MSAACERVERHELARIDLRKSRGASSSESEFRVRRVNLAASELVNTSDAAREEAQQVERAAASEAPHETVKLAGEQTATSERNESQPAGGRHSAAQCEKQPQKRAGGLLEALLGERGRNWFEHKTVVLNIQNGRQRQTQSAASESFKKLDIREGEQEEGNKPQQVVEAPRESAKTPQDASSKYARLPTFGSVPQRLERATPSKPLPYFAYSGRARNQQATGRRPASGGSSGEQDRNSVSSSGRLSSASQSTSADATTNSSRTTSAASSVLASPRRLPTSPRTDSTSTSRTASRSTSRLGFSNISNLFPGAPVRTRQRAGPSRSASLVDLAAEKQAYARQQQQIDRLLRSDERARENQGQRLAARTRPASATMRQRTGAGGQQLSAAGSHANVKSSYQQQPSGRARPASATGNYLSGAAGRQRSPGASYRLGSAGMSPLIDPDCPVHGDQLGRAPPPPVSASQRGRSYDRDKYHLDAHERRPHAHDYQFGSASQPDLLYAPTDDPYNLARPAAAYGLPGERHRASAAGFQQASPVYSPLSPIDYEPGGFERARATNGPAATHAYYNNSARFGLFHPTGDGAGTMRSALAPTGEQLRRILGYKPAGAPAKPVHLHPQWAYTRPFIHLQPAGSGFGRSPSPGGELSGEALALPHFAPFNRLQDNQAVRAVDFHPSGEVYAVGSNSRALRICAYPAEHELRHFEPAGLDGPEEERRPARPPRVLFKFLQLHRGSIYCVAFNPSGQLLATGSNDQTVHLARYNAATHNPDGEEFRLTMHSGTVRDLCFIDDSSGAGGSLLLSAGGGDNKIYVTDCDTVTPFQSMAGHTQMVMALGHCGGAQFVSGSYDRTIRFWDLRARSCTSIVSAPAGSPTGAPSPAAHAGHALASGPGAPVCALRVDPSGRLLASGHTDSTCMLYDIRGAKIIQTFRPHDDEVRAISFSPKSYYLLTGGYDGRLVVSDLQGDLTQALPSVCVAESQDKVVQAKWHPADFTFVSTSADKSATLWSLPGEIRN